jgi:hypothetical protein
MTDLSPAAQAVLDAAGDSEPGIYATIAAALRAASALPSDLAVPLNVVAEWEEIKGSCARFYAAATWGYNQALAAQRAIATELEGQ